MVVILLGYLTAPSEFRNGNKQKTLCLRYKIKVDMEKIQFIIRLVRKGVTNRIYHLLHGLT